MTIDFYYIPVSAPCRSVQLAANMLGVELNLKPTNLFKGEHMTPEFLKMNFQHVIPTLNDNGFVIWESHAILCYLAEAYPKNDTLYPKDPKKRGAIHQRLFFDSGTLYQRFKEYYFPMLHKNEKPDPVRLDNLKEAFEFLDKYLEGQAWVAGDHLTIADLAIVATVSSAEVFGYDVTKHANVAKWLAKAKKTIPNYNEINHAACLDYKKLFDSRPTNFKIHFT